MPRCWAYQAACALGSRALKNTPPTPTAFAMGSLLLFGSEQIVQPGFVFGLAAGSGRVAHYARGLWLAHTFARIGLYRLGSGELCGLAFGHGFPFGLAQARLQGRVWIRSAGLYSPSLV